MFTSSFRRRGPAVAAALATLASTTTAFAATYNYVSWTAADVAAGTASGTIALAGDAGVNVTFTATTADGGVGDLYGAQTGGGGTNYWSPPETYQSSAVENAPPTSDIIQLAGGENETYTVTLSQPIVDPIMAVVSLGADGAPITYNFDSPFTIVSQGTDPWGGSSTSLVQLPNNVLQGAEGSGIIQFIGTYSKFSWTVPDPETWHGFTFGVLTSAALYDGGGPDGSTTVIGEDGGPVSPDAGTAGGDAGASDASAAPPDGGGAPDAGTGLDASPPDAAGSVDATVPAPDSGGSASGSGEDSGAGAGPGSSVPGESASCSCTEAGIGGGSTGALGALGALLGAAGLLGRRRSRAR